MPTFELAKSIEAAPLNPRTLIPTGDTPVTVPYGAIIEHIEHDRDFDKFSYLGQPYRCAHDIFKAAVRQPKPEPASSGKPAPAAVEPSAGATQGERRALVWEELESSHGSVRRARVPGGWLVSVAGDGLAFYPDSLHAWDGTSVP
jgi:hypothetical protein